MTQLEEESRRREEFYRDMTPEQKVEFIDGEIVMHSPARNEHLDASGFLFRLMCTFVDLRNLGSVKMEKCLCVFPRNDYEPDIVFFGPAKTAALEPGTLRFPPPDLVVEVLSESTEARDRGVKFEDFETNGVQEYWIVDADAQTIEQYILKSEGYELRLKSNSGKLSSEAIPGFEIPIAAAFDREQNLAVLKQMVASD